jgi:hypothetical protein
MKYGTYGAVHRMLRRALASNRLKTGMYSYEFGACAIINGSMTSTSKVCITWLPNPVPSIVIMMKCF